MRDQFCDVISYCAYSCGIGKIRVRNKIVIENPTKNMEIREFVHDFSSKECMDWKSQLSEVNRYARDR